MLNKNLTDLRILCLDRCIELPRVCAGGGGVEGADQGGDGEPLQEEARGNQVDCARPRSRGPPNTIIYTVSKFKYSLSKVIH